MKKYIYLLLILVLASCANLSKKEAHLKGQLEGLGSKQHVLMYNGTSSLIGKSRDIVLSVDENGYFDTVIPLEKPEYYAISRNTLYLSPGDDLEIFITEDNTEAQFNGKGSEANNYLKNRLFPKGGSFLESGKNTREDFASTKSLVDSLADVRYKELDALDGVSETFKELEKARITADVINSYICYMYYGKELKNLSSREESAKFREKHVGDITEYVNPLFRQINHDDYLNVAVVRDVFSYHDEYYKNWFAGVEETAFRKELYQVDQYANKMDNEPTPALLDEVASALSGLSDANILHELKLKLEKARTLQPGQPAPDFIISDISGETMRMSDFKGKLIYIDFWATWCGPCIAESPYFESLAEKFSGKDIVFIPVSVDNTSDIWLKYLEKHEKKLTQYYTADPDFRDKWSLKFIPRFVLIDKDFTIINAYASQPSDEETEKLLDTLLLRP